MAAPAGGDDAAAPDAALIRNCAALLTMEREWRNSSQGGNYPDHQERYNDLIDEVTATPALTEAGNRAKLAVVVSFLEPDAPDTSIVDEMLWDAIRAIAMPPATLDRLAAGGGEA